jgi:hypothetical protein
MLFCQFSDDSSLCTSAVLFLYRMIESWCHHVPCPMYKYLLLFWTELLIGRISMKDYWMSNITEWKWHFDLTIYLSVHITFLSTVVAQCFSFLLSNSAVTVSMLALSTDCTVTCYLQTFWRHLNHNVLRQIRLFRVTFCYTLNWDIRISGCGVLVFLLLVELPQW